MWQRILNAWVKHPSFMIFVLLPQFFSSPQAIAANTIAYSALGVTCSQHTAADIYGHRYVAGTNAQIVAINALIPSGTVSNSTFKANFPSATYVIMANNGNSGPTTTLATFTADTMTGVNARFVGSYNITAGTKFWIFPSQAATVFPDCYTVSGAVPNANVIFNNGWRLDTSTSTAWPYSMGNTISSLSSINQYSYLFPISIELAPTSSATISLAFQNGSKVATYKSSTTLLATTSTEGKVSFYQSGKIIAGCKNVLTSSLVATCNWKPAIHGAVPLKATITPTDNSIPKGTSNALQVGVVPRVNTR